MERDSKPSKSESRFTPSTSPAPRENRSLASTVHEFRNGHAPAGHRRQAVIGDVGAAFGNRIISDSISATNDATVQSSPTTLVESLGGMWHTVRAGDSLWSMSQSTYGSGGYWQDIVNANPGKTAKDGALILVGSTLWLPKLTIPVASTDSSESSDHGARRTSFNGQEDAGSEGGAERSEFDIHDHMSFDPIIPDSGLSIYEPMTTSDSVPESLLDIVEADSPKTPARSCMYPAVKLDPADIVLEDAYLFLPGVGHFLVALKMVGDVTFQKSGSCLPWTFDKNGLRIDAQHAANDLVSGMYIAGIGGEALTIGSKLAGEYNVTRIGHKFPNTMLFQSKTRMADITHGDLHMTINLGFKAEVTFSPDFPNGERITRREGPQSTWDWSPPSVSVSPVPLVALTAIGIVAIGIAVAAPISIPAMTAAGVATIAFSDAESALSSDSDI